jgi:hypothetical protein
LSYNPDRCKENAFKEIAQAEADVAQCMADFVCCILDELKHDHKHTVEEKIELFRCLILAAAVKEKAIAAVVNALANNTLAQKGPCDAANVFSDDDD